MTRTLTRTALAVVLGLTGCGGGKATVQGKVTHRGKALACGTVLLVGADGVTVAGEIAGDGSYAVAGVTAGPVQVGVVSKPPRAGARPSRGGPVRTRTDARASPAADRSKWFPIPEKYAEPTTSGLGLTLQAGANTQDIELP
jgi:hypothetical protein